MSETLRSMDDRRHQITKQIRAALEARLPVGRVVHVTWGESEVPAEVTMHSYGERVQVRSLRSEKEYWVDMHRLVEVRDGRV